MRLNPRKSPKTPPRDDIRSISVIFRLLSYSEKILNVFQFASKENTVPIAVASPKKMLITAMSSSNASYPPDLAWNQHVLRTWTGKKKDYIITSTLDEINSFSALLSLT